MVHPHDRDRVLTAWRETIAAPAPGAVDRFNHEFRLRDARTGGYRWFLSVAVPLRHPDGRVDRWIGSMADIHDQKSAAEAIRQSEAFRRSVFENSPDCLKVIDTDGRILEINVAGCRLLDLDGPEAVLNVPWADLWPVPNRETVREAVTAARAGQTTRFQGFCPTAAGTPKYWDVSVAPLPGADGTPYRLISVSRDVTEQRRAEDAVRASERRFRTLTEAVPQMVWTADPTGAVTFFNRRWDEYTGAPLGTGSPGEWGGGVVYEPDAGVFRAHWARAVAEPAQGFARGPSQARRRWRISVDAGGRAALARRDRCRERVGRNAHRHRRPEAPDGTVGAAGARAHR